MTAPSTYVALLDGGKREETVKVTPVAPGVYDVEVRGKLHRVDAVRHDPVTMSLLEAGESHSVRFDARAAAVHVNVGDDAFAIDLLDERRLRMRRASGAFAADGQQVLTATMPGKVVKVLIRAGAAVRAGQAVVVLEAMKMENEIRSPRDGTVKELRVAEGQPVEGGATIAVIE